jgi:short-subunit dehydrogenase
MSIELSGKRALITGASSGIGRAIALALAEAGVEVAVSARREQALARLADEIEALGHKRAVVLTADLSKRGEAKRLAARAVEALGAVDILVNNAGVGIGGTQVNIGDDDMARELFETNYWSPLALVSALAPPMRERKSGAIVNVSSIGSYLVLPLAGHYSSSKAALSRATDSLELELRATGVHVFHVMPGPVDTGMLAELAEVPGGEKMLARMPRGTPAALARKIVAGLERGRRVLVYPGALAISRHIPTVAQAMNRSMARVVDVNDPRMLKGGSAGDPLALAAREAFERKALATAAGTK